MSGQALGKGQPKDTVKITVRQSPIPGYANLMSAHQPVQGLLVETVFEKRLVIIGLASSLQILKKTAHRHIGDRQQIREVDAETVPELLAISVFEFRLVRGQKCAAGVVHQVDRQALITAVTELVQPAQAGDTALVNALSTLIVDIFVQVAWQ